MNETKTQQPEAAAQPAALNPEASIAGAAAFASAESMEILNLLGGDSAGGSCCGGSCCAPSE
ncbi:hypothetical protein ACI1US_01331 [Leucobacter sp. BZR 635]